MQKHEDDYREQFADSIRPHPIATARTTRSGTSPSAAEGTHLRLQLPQTSLYPEKTILRSFRVMFEALSAVPDVHDILAEMGMSLLR